MWMSADMADVCILLSPWRFGLASS